MIHHKIKQPKKVLLVGPVLSYSGYGEHARCVLRSLVSQLSDFDIYIAPTNWGATSTDTANTPETRFINNCIVKYNNNKETKYDISLQVALPNEWRDLAVVNIGITAAVETDRCNPQWIQSCNKMNKVIVVSEHAGKSLTSMTYQTQDEHGNPSGMLKCNTPIAVVGYPIKSFENSSFSEQLDLCKFNFLSIAQLAPRKNIYATLKWFVEEFYSEDVGLLIKSNLVNDSLGDKERAAGFLRQMLQNIDPENKRQCKVQLLHGRLSEEDLHSLYCDKRVKGYITTAHGEGFGLPIFEAAYSGLPVIATNWSGHLDFLRAPITNKQSGKTKTQSLFLKTKFDIKAVQPESLMEGIITPESQWAYPDEKAFKKNLRTLYVSHKKYKNDAKILQDYLLTEMTEEKIYDKMVEEIMDAVNPTEDNKDLSVAML